MIDISLPPLFSGVFLNKQGYRIPLQQESAMISKTVFHSRTHRILTAALVAAIGLGFSLTALGQSAAPAGGPPGMLSGSAGGVQAAGGSRASASGRMPGALGSAAVGIEESAQKGSAGLNQSLKMHGHWIIDIKNPDGTLAHHHEFENSIQYDGQNYLIGLMSGYGAAGNWEIYFSSVGSVASTSPCNTAAYPYCAIVASTTSQPGAFVCNGLYTCATGLTITPTFGVGPTLTLAGSIVATQAGSIGFVGTGMAACGGTAGANGYPTAISTITPAACYTSTTSQFSGTATSTTLASPIPVASGQIMQVTVILSLS
jgi:hypothetical protein